jgi:hypothetical protein
MKLSKIGAVTAGGKPVTEAGEPTIPLLMIVPAVPLPVTAVPPSSAKLSPVPRIDAADPDVGAQSSAAKATRADKFNALYFFILIPLGISW